MDVAQRSIWTSNSVDKRLEKRLTRRFNKAIFDYHLVEDGDFILAALSGGKDSLYLVEALARRKKILYPRFSVEAVHVRMQNIEYETDTSYLQTFCEELGIKLHVLTTSFDASTDKRKSPCFLCSWNRRKQLFQLAQELGCNKIALGHHKDDLIQTALMNLFFQGRFDTMPPALRMQKMPLTLIRPLCLEEEKDIRQYAQERQYQPLRKLCPYETSTYRADMAQLIEQLKELNPIVENSIWNALQL